MNINSPGNGNLNLFFKLAEMISKKQGRFVSCVFGSGKTFFRQKQQLKFEACATYDNSYERI